MTSILRACVAVGLLAASLSLLGLPAKESCLLANRYHLRGRTTQFFERVPHSHQPQRLAPSLRLPKDGPAPSQIGQSEPRPLR
jgi:hypothetical protein